MRAAIIAFFAVVLVDAASAVDQRPIGNNCNLTAPPQSAGEEMNHGIVLRVFPRAKDIGPSYSGCQALFVPHGGGWKVVSLTEVAQGDPVRVWSPHERLAKLKSLRHCSTFASTKITYTSWPEITTWSSSAVLGPNLGQPDAPVHV